MSGEAIYIYDKLAFIISIIYFLLGIYFIVLYFKKEPGLIGEFILFLAQHPIKNKKRIFLATLLCWTLSSFFMMAGLTPIKSKNKIQYNWIFKNPCLLLISQICAFSMLFFFIGFFILKAKKRKRLGVIIMSVSALIFLISSLFLIICLNNLEIEFM